MEKKKREERRSYPEILQKLTLYLEAGLTVRSAFCRVAEDYEKERKRGGRCREAYEEMLIATREIHMGVPEGAAYENFGKRTGVREYVRLSTFLTQNLKKGSSTLLQQLKEESVQAEELRIQNARKLSEEATTKLLLPMVMLLVVVMVMIMVPAFSNAGLYEKEGMVMGNNKLKSFRQFLTEEDGMGTVEVILIIVVLVGLVIIFKEKITEVVNSIFTKITNQTKKI